MMIKEDRFNVPKREGSDIAYAALEVVANILPFAGPELFRLLISSPLEDRKKKWMESVSEWIQEQLEKGNINIQELSQNEEFISFLIRTSKIAISQHDDEKLEYLKNSLVNSILDELDYDVKYALLNAVDELSPRHIHLLKYIKVNNYNTFQNDSLFTSVQDILKGAADEFFKGDISITEVFFDNLLKLKLLDKVEVLTTDRQRITINSYRISSWGERLLNFISQPSIPKKDL